MVWFLTCDFSMLQLFLLKDYLLRFLRSSCTCLWNFYRMSSSNFSRKTSSVVSLKNPQKCRSEVIGGIRSDIPLVFFPKILTRISLGIPDGFPPGEIQGLLVGFFQDSPIAFSPIALSGKPAAIFLLGFFLLLVLKLFQKLLIGFLLRCALCIPWGISSKVLLRIASGICPVNSSKIYPGIFLRIVLKVLLGISSSIRPVNSLKKYSDFFLGITSKNSSVNFFGY